MSRRTETAHKAEPLGKSAQHDKVLDSRDSRDAGNAAIAASPFTFLFGGGDLPIGTSLGKGTRYINGPSHHPSRGVKTRSPGLCDKSTAQSAGGRADGSICVY